MKTVRVLITVLLLSFTSLGLTELPPVAGTMTYSRDDYAKQACLEYSWVPQGKRHTIRLLSGEKKKSRTDAIAMSRPSHVQIYSLSNNNQAGLKMWQFPPGPPHATPVVRATVEVNDKEVVGTVYYRDGSSASDKHQLDVGAIKCPEISEQR